MNNQSYLNQVTNERVLLIREVKKGLPSICDRFEISIQSTTSELTRLAYLLDLKVFCHFLESEVAGFDSEPANWNDEVFSRVKMRDVEQYISFLNYYGNEDDICRTNGDYGKMRKLSSLRKFFKFLLKNYIIPTDPCALVDMPKIHEKPILRLDVDEVAKILDMAESGEALTDKQKGYHELTKIRDVTILTVFLGTGIRVSELVGLNIYDLNFENDSFLVTRKGGNQVILYMPYEVSKQLKSYMKWRDEQSTLPGHENALFLSLQKRRITVRAVEKMVKKYSLLVSPLKPRISPHKLRSTFGTNLYSQTGDIYLVADVLGHTDVNTTRKHYADMLDEHRRKATKSVVLRTTAQEDTQSKATNKDERS